MTRRSSAGPRSTPSAGCRNPRKSARSWPIPTPTSATGLVDRLVDRPEFADFWALKWADLLRNEEKTMGEKGVWVFQRWLRDEFARDLPLDELARALTHGRGLDLVEPAGELLPDQPRSRSTAAETVGQVFLGVRLQCARCHNHPFDVWTQDDYYGLAAFFGNVAHKQINNVRRDALDSHEINGDEIIYLSGKPEMVQPRTGAMMEPKAPRGPKPRLRGTDVEGADRDARIALADWLTRGNRAVCPEHGQPDLVPPDRPGRRRSRRRLPRLEPAVEPGPARRARPTVSSPGDAAPAACWPGS